MRPIVGGDDARGVVRHFRKQHHKAGRLKDLIEVVVGRRGHRRPLMGPGQAPLLGRPILVTLETARVTPQRRQDSRVLGPRRNTPIRRVDNERGATARQSLGVRRPQPHGVVVVGRVRLHRRRLSGGRVLVQRIGERPTPQRVDPRRRQGLDQRGRLFLRQERLIGQLLRTLKRGKRLGRPHALQVWSTIRGARHGPGLGRLGTRDRRNGQQQNRREEPKALHVCPPGSGSIIPAWGKRTGKNRPALQYVVGPHAV